MMVTAEIAKELFDESNIVHKPGERVLRVVVVPEI